MRTRAAVLACALGVLSVGCDSGSGTTDGGTADTGAMPSDGGPDLGADLGPVDLGPPDLGVDAGPPCVGPPGLWSDMHCSVLATGVREYAPEFTLWADSSGKNRWVYLPAGTQIDVTSSDAWVFPMGTRFYKEFGLPGRPLEIRMLEKTMPDPGLSSWSVRSFEWDMATTTMTETTTLGAMSILGTDHDIPTRAQCGQCHGPANDAILGFSAVQLAHGTGVDLATLNTEGWLATGTSHTTTTIAPATAEIPGDAVVRPALGYMHANCSHCHHGTGAPAGMRLEVLTGLTMPSETQAYLTAVGVATTSFHATGITGRVVAGMPDASAIPYRMNHRGDAAQMPPLGTKHVDDTGLATVRAWIMGLP